MHRSLGGIKADQFLDREMRQLAADLATNATGRSRNKDRLIFQLETDLAQIYTDLLTTQQVLNTDLTD